MATTTDCIIAVELMPAPPPAGNLSCADPRSPPLGNNQLHLHLHHRLHLRESQLTTSPSPTLARPPLRSDATPSPSSPATQSSPNIDIIKLSSPALSYLDSPPSVGHNQAPGILDRRKTLPLGRRRSVTKSAKRPAIARATTSGSTKGRLSTIPKKNRLSSTVELRPELKIKGEDNMDDNSGVETFEDALEQDTTRPSTSDSDLNSNGGLAAPPAKRPDSENQQPTSTESHTDDDAPQNTSSEASQVNSPENSRQGALDSPPELSKSISRDRSISPTKRLPIIPRDRSLSPTKLADGQRSPVRVVRGLSGDLPGPGMFPPPPSTSERAQNLERTQSSSPTPAAPGFARKASAGLSGFLGRMGTMRKQARSPSVPRDGHERRNTQSSVTSVDSNMADDRRFSGLKPSLQEQFKSLRSQQEDSDDSVLFEGDVEATPKANRHSNASLALASPAGSIGSVDRPLKSPPLNPGLPRGTAQGVSAGPPQDDKAVDWNLWQSLVSEGPAALARSSGEELSKAIAAGIPQAIRGVVWQVLAESKNEELEIVYRTLRARGSSDADSRPPPSRSGSTSTPNGTIDEESGPSPTTSTQDEPSNSSTPPTVTPSPAADGNFNGAASEVKIKLLAEKQKRELATIAKLEKVIKRDMGTRTSYSKYVQAAGLQDSLFGVCKAYALFDEGVGYAQGINFIIMPLLFYMAEEEAFTLFVRLMSKYDVRSLFTADMPGLHRRLYQFERLLEDHEPALACHLKRRNVGPQLYATQWFLTLFTYRFPLQLTTRVYDLVFAEGLSAIFKFALALMQQNRQVLLGMKDMGQLSTFLKEKLFDFYIDKAPSSSTLLDSSFFGAVTGGVDKEVYRADDMVRDACEVKIAESDLTRYGNEWEEQSRGEHERAEELEKLRSASISLTARVRQLEVETQQKDTDHVTIASDMVHVKVENERLSDENEGLNMRVEELQRLVDKQPAEIEATLREEMERIMQRNIEVQNENRALKEEMDEFESELVRVKMAHAETLSDHETLKQKWSGMQALMKDSR